MPGGSRSAAVALLLLWALRALADGDEPPRALAIDALDASATETRHLLYFGTNSSIFSSPAVAALLSGAGGSRPAAAASPAAPPGGRPAGPYSPDQWGQKTVIVTKHQPASHCGTSSPLAFRSRVRQPAMSSATLGLTNLAQIPALCSGLFTNET